MRITSLNSRFIAIAACLASTLAWAGSSLAEKTEPSVQADKKVTFDDDVKPILRQHCMSCHHQGEQKGGVALDTFQAILEGGGSGEIVYDDGDADSSRLWQLVAHEDTPVMPPNQDRIPDEQLAVIRSWIEGGILENSGSKAKAKKKNALEFVAASKGKPEGPAAMPTTMPLDVQIVTDRPAATTAIACSPWAPLVAIAGQQQILFYHSETCDLLGITPFAEGIAESLRFSRDGAYLIAGGGEHSVRGLVAIYDVRTGERITQVGDELDIVLDADANSALNRVALGGPTKMLRIYDAAEDKLLFDLKKHTDWILSVAFSPDDVLIASSDRSAGLVVWEAATGREYLNLTGHKGGINAVAWRDDSNVLASASDDGTVRLWDMNSGKQIKSINVGNPVLDVSMDHKGRLITAARNGTVTLWKADGGKQTDFPRASEAALQAALSHDGNRAVFGDWNGVIKNLAVAAPKQATTLVSNPPTESVLADELRKRIAEQQNTVAKAQKAGDISSSEADAINQPWKAAVAKKAAALKSADEHGMAAEKHSAKAKSLRESVALLTEQSREMQDEMIATRVGMRKKQSKPAEVADVETKFGKLLLRLAADRTSIETSSSAASNSTKSAAEQKAIAAKLAEQLPDLEKAAKAATEKSDRVGRELESSKATLKQLEERLERLQTTIADQS